MFWFAFISSAILVYDIGVQKCLSFAVPDFSQENGEQPSEICFTLNKNPYTLFSTKTSYLNPDIGNRNTDEIKLSGKK